MSDAPANGHGSQVTAYCDGEAFIHAPIRGRITYIGIGAFTGRSVTGGNLLIAKWIGAAWVTVQTVPVQAGRSGSAAFALVPYKPEQAFEDGERCRITESGVNHGDDATVNAFFEP